jgi:hypothetical protein
MLRVSQPRIISFVQLLGKPGIFRPLLEYCMSRVNRSPPGDGTRDRRDRLLLKPGAARKTLRSKLAQAFQDKIFLRRQVP